MRRTALALMIPLAGLSLTPAATAQRDEIFFDNPDSPSAQEYAIPLDRARAEAGAGTRAYKGGTALFGAGIRSDGTGAEPMTGGGRSAGGSGGDRRSGGAESGPLPPGPLREAAARSSGGGGGSPGLTVAGIGVAVLLVGGLLGLLLRRLAGSGST